jgi:serine/threonine protein kinase
VVAAAAVLLHRRRRARGATGGDYTLKTRLLKGGLGGGGDDGTSAAATAHTPQVFSYDQLELATDDFSHERMLAEGAFGVVFRGTLPGGCVVAIKVLKPAVAAKITKSGGTEWSGAGGFRKELSVLSRHHHLNLVSLHGYSFDAARSQYCLLFEYMDGGSLLTRLQAGRDAAAADPDVKKKKKEGKKKKKKKGEEVSHAQLTAQQRFDIASDVARGLEYLHVDADPPLIHQDVKSDNILLCRHGGRLVAKVADFGTARFAPALLKGTHHSTCHVVGTVSYMPLEYLQMGQVSEKTDTYAFGVVLLELLTAEDPCDSARSEAFALQMYTALGDAELGLPPLLDRSAGPWPQSRALALGRIARRCIEMAAADRSEREGESSQPSRAPLAIATAAATATACV